MILTFARAVKISVLQDIAVLPHCDQVRFNSPTKLFFKPSFCNKHSGWISSYFPTIFLKDPEKSYNSVLPYKIDLALYRKDRLQFLQVPGPLIFWSQAFIVSYDTAPQITACLLNLSQATDYCLTLLKF